jgi:RelA/SpoT family (p)ppGpp synthetase
MLFFRESRKRRGAQPGPTAAGGDDRTDERLEALVEACLANLGSVNTELIRDAYHFAEEAHAGQLRNSGDPYFFHPYAVSMIVAQELPLDDISIASALLHDVVEDCEDVTYEEVADAFGGTVADIVDGVTKISNILKSREITKAENYRKLMISMVKDIRVILVKFADRLHNMRTLDYVPLQKQARIARETLEIYAPLAHRFGLGRIKWELEDLAFKYLKPEAFAQLRDQIALRRRDREEYLMRFTKPLRPALEKTGCPVEISSRPKHLYSIFKKMVDQNRTIDEIYDLLAVRIILDTEEEKTCYLAYAIVCELYMPIPERYKNFIALPKQNGYRSIHTTVLGPDGKMVEVQIRTRQMHDVAERGIAAHWAYKEQVAQKKSGFENWIRWVREILEAQQAASTDEEGAQQLIDNFKRNLFQEEIVVFTPKGDLKVLPAGATPVDFAFEIHSEVGLHCIGAKVMGRIVPLNRKLRSGDQVEIITSRSQYLSPDWEQFVVTDKARNGIRKFVREQSEVVQQKGREKFERKTRRLKLHIGEEDLVRTAGELHFPSLSKMFVALGRDEIHVDDILGIATRPPLPPREAPAPERDPAEVFQEFARQARGEQGILIDGQQRDVEYDFARCCSPLPGDDVVGFVTVGKGVKIHRRNCRNILRLLNDTTPDNEKMRARLVSITWPAAGAGEYLSGIRIEGDDRPGILNEIALAITTFNNTNIRSVNIDTRESVFTGSVLVSVGSLEHLQRLIEKLRKVRGVTVAERYIEVA